MMEIMTSNGLNRWLQTNFYISIFVYIGIEHLLTGEKSGDTFK